MRQLACLYHAPVRNLNSMMVFWMQNLQLSNKELISRCTQSLDIYIILFTELFPVQPAKRLHC